MTPVATTASGRPVAAAIWSRPLATVDRERRALRRPAPHRRQRLPTASRPVRFPTIAPVATDRSPERRRHDETKPALDGRVLVGAAVAVVACLAAVLAVNRGGSSGDRVHAAERSTAVAKGAAWPSTTATPARTPSTTATPAPTPSTDPTAEATTSSPPAPTGRVGAFLPAPGQTAVIGTGRLVTYTVEVEEAVGVDPVEVGAIVDAALIDPRGWTADGRTSFQRIETGGQVRIVLATPTTVDKLCLPLRTNGIFSCRQGNQMNLNADRWRNGTDRWPLGVDEYRAHVVNHEMGHALGHGHKACPGPGQLAPVMMQQTKGLDGCVANGWPYPDRPAA